MVGPVTFREAGLAAFAAYVLMLGWGVVRRPTGPVLVFAAALSFFGFFMLPTQVHQRYIVPAVGLLALLAPLSRRGFVLFGVLTATATNSSGQTSAASGAVTVTVDTVAPTAPALSSRATKIEHGK